MLNVFILLYFILELKNMKDIPKLGLGFWQIEKSDAKRVFLEGYEVGYRHFDTAIIYGNESEIGDAIKELKPNREEIWLTSKIPAEIKSYKKAKKAIDESLKRLGVDYLDLMLIHAPKPWVFMFMPGPRYHKGNREVWRAMVDAKKEGKIKNLGVSNFNVNDIKNITNYSNEPIYVNQILIHVGRVPKEVINYCQNNNILVEAYSPLGVGKLLKNEKIIEMAKKNNVSPAQLCIKYVDELGTIPLPRSRSKKHMENNFHFDFELSKEDKEQLDKMKI